MLVNLELKPRRGVKQTIDTHTHNQHQTQLTTARKACSSRVKAQSIASSNKQATQGVLRLAEKAAADHSGSYQQLCQLLAFSKEKAYDRLPL